MPSKKYSSIIDETTSKQTVIKEAKAQHYGREREHGQGARPASIATVKRRLKKTVKRSKRDIAWALDIVGIGEGPADLSERAREYLYGNK